MSNRYVEEAKWLIAHPHFDQKPATILEFLGPGYLDIESKVRQGLKDTLVEIFGDEVNGERIANYEEAMVTGGIGIGKTTFASIALPYMVHWTLCLRDPQDYFELLPGSRIAFMQMSTSESQALQVIFGDIKARVDHSEWFVQNYPRNEKFTKQIRFPKDIWILPGDSQETTFEGYNILAGILDEMDSHKVTRDKDYADEGFNTIQSRIASRFIDDKTNGHRGLLICIGQMKKGDGFAARKFEEMQKNPRASVTRMSIWESLGWQRFLKSDGSGDRDSFWYDRKRKMVVPTGIAFTIANDDFIEVPNAYKQQFSNNPEKALRDLAGIPPATSDPFISLVDRIDECRTRWIEDHIIEGQAYDESDPSTLPFPVGDNPRRPEFAPWFVGHGDPRRRAVHIDIATSGNGDALGFVMGHISEMVEVNGELKPLVTIDCMIRVKVSAGQEILLSDIRQIIYDLKYERGFRITNVTMDGFQCLAGETRIPLLDGRTLTMKELAEQYPNGGVHAYTYDGTKITAGKVEKAWRTSSKETLQVHLDNGEVIECTPDHRFMLRDGTYRQAQELVEDDSIMPLYRRVVEKADGFMDHYEQVAQPKSATTTRWEYTHRAVAGDAPEGYVRHHVDHDHLNNDPSNLEIISRGEHSAHHHTGEFWTDERRTNVTAAISKSNSERVGLEARNRRLDVTLEDLVPYAHLSRRVVTQETGWSQDMIYARLREAGYAGWAEFRKAQASANNHKVTKIVWTGKVQDVYDLQVEGTHNFALESGVFVHNSTDTMQQLRKKKFIVDYLSVDRTTLPYEDLREAIYERRLNFPPFLTHMNPGDTKTVEIAIKELQQLSYDGKKVDHPATGSKDVADGLAGVTSALMGDRTYRRGVSSYRAPDAGDSSGDQAVTLTPRFSFDPPSSPIGHQAPYGGSMGALLPKRLRGR